MCDNVSCPFVCVVLVKLYVQTKLHKYVLLELIRKLRLGLVVNARIYLGECKQHPAIMMMVVAPGKLA